jgi:sugar phosphate isomerase/epimerase
MGADPVVIHPGYTFWMGKINDVVERSWTYFVHHMKELLLHAKKKNVTISLESVPMHFFFFYDLPEFKKLQEVLPGLRMTLDIGHAYVTKIAKRVNDPEGAIIEDLRDLGVHNVSHVHLHNNRGERDEHLFPDGNIDIKRILDFLNDEGYAGKVIIESYEMENKGIPSALEKLKKLFP